MTVKNKDKSTWLHLGAGAFHRAHQSWYLNQLHQQGDNSWHLALANIRNSATQKTLQQLAKQHGRYTLELISPEGDINYETISSIKDIILWDKGLESLISVGAQPETKIISFTVTEGGYFLDDDGHLDIEDEAIQSDLNDQNETATLYGALVKILRARMNKKPQASVTLLSCDNLRSNGDSFWRGLTDFISAKQDDALLSWVKAHASAPNSMVDRITPKFDTAIYDRLVEQGITDDSVPLACESFSQWVIEDHFIVGRPALENAGVEFVDDVTPYEEAKIRILNASHSGIAWAGGLLDKKYIDQSLTPQVTTWIRNYVLQDVVPCLSPAEFDLADYCETTLNRFSNRWVRDTCQRVSSDSIAKIHEFIVPTLKTRYQQGKEPQAALILPALYYTFMRKRYQKKLAFDYLDGQIKRIDFDAIFSSADPQDAFARTSRLFGSLTKNPDFSAQLRNAITCVEDWVKEGH